MPKEMTLLLFMAAAVVKDRQTSRIPNLLLAAGAANGCFLRFYESGWTGLGDGMIGAVIPLILCGWLFVLSMLGAGDVKLMMAVGIYFGPMRSIRIVAESWAIGAGMALVRLTDSRLAVERGKYLLNYLRCAATGELKAYVDMRRPNPEKKWLIHFSVPIMLAVVFEIFSGLTQL